MAGKRAPKGTEPDVAGSGSDSEPDLPVETKRAKLSAHALQETGYVRVCCIPCMPSLFRLITDYYFNDGPDA